ncbi:MAG TPA: serine hydrolase domain-containing protein [Solirubrobacteraceae bacterium]|jgi:CubicO group peptidase (beta-lactamase class C family)|nr:serine hydrolase domain-containing protein [Solirubrobacteraceae bacterium]
MAFDGSGIEQLLSGAVSDGTYAGVSALVVGRDGVLHQSSHGEAREDTMFRNASMTKALATVGALQLVEQGRLDLAATVESILPAFGELQVLDGFDGERPRLRPPASKATIRQLMSHTAGCGYFFLNANFARYAELTGLPSPLTGLKASLRGPLVNDPGKVWEYGVNTDWLGLVVEELSGQTLGAYLAEHVFGPLGMTDMTFRPTDAQRARLLPIRTRDAEGVLVEMGLDFPPDPEWDAAGHGSFGTIGDYGRFLQAMLNGGGGVLKRETVDLAFSDQLNGAPLPEIMVSVDKTLSNDVPSLPVPQGWGLGFHLVSVDLPGMRSAGTGDWAGICNTYYWIDRSAGIGGAIMTQVLPFFDDRIVPVLLGFEMAVYEQVGAAVPAA